MINLETRIIVCIFDFGTSVDVYTVDAFKKHLSENYDIAPSIYEESIREVIDVDPYELESHEIYDRINDDAIFNQILNKVIEAAKDTEYVIIKEECAIVNDKVYLPEKVIYEISQSV